MKGDEYLAATDEGMEKEASSLEGKVANTCSPAIPFIHRINPVIHCF